MSQVSEYQSLKNDANKSPIEPKDVKNHVGDWDYYVPQILEIIEGVIKRGDFPYNSTIENEVIENGLEIPEEKLSRAVYNTQSYRHWLDIKKKYDDHVEKYKDWKVPTEEEIKEMVKKRKFVEVVGLFGEPFRARPFIDADDRLFWMKPRFRRRGFILAEPRIKI